LAGATGVRRSTASRWALVVERSWVVRLISTSSFSSCASSARASSVFSFSGAMRSMSTRRTSAPVASTRIDDTSTESGRVASSTLCTPDSELLVVRTTRA
jgi:hypothetical protein